MKKFLLMAIVAFSMINCDELSNAKEVIVEFDAT